MNKKNYIPKLSCPNLFKNPAGNILILVLSNPVIVSKGFAPPF